MSLSRKLGKAFLNSEYVSRHVTKYKTDADYRYRVQENILIGTMTVGVFGLFVVGVAAAIKAENAAMLAGDIPYAATNPTFVEAVVDDGLWVSVQELKEIIISNERGYFDTPVGMFGVEFFGEGAQLFGE
jgi:hypothetical protein